MATKSEVEQMRRAIRKMPGTVGEKCTTLDVSGSWLYKFLAGEIRRPSEARLEQLRKVLG